jgi:hypothetical protein
MTVLLDDHLLRDWMVGADLTLRRAAGREDIATTNLWYARLAKSAARAGAGAGALLGGLSPGEREGLVSALVRLPTGITVVPMPDLAWRMGVLVSAHRGLSTLGSEAVAAAEALEGRLLVSSRDDGPGVRSTCMALGIEYATVDR